jgi:DNA-binding NtrC family response regulator
MAVEAIKAGAYDYLPKPFEVDDLRLAVKNAAETISLRRENQKLREQIELEAKTRGSLLGESEAMRRVRALIEKVAETDATVLVRGESGTGKELVARELHERGRERRRGAFVAVNCAALPSELIESELFGHEKGAFTGAHARRQGKFEQADGGTIFLDEIGDMSANVQAKLLRALEERRIERLGGSESIPVDVRVVSATHRPLEQEIEKGNFRADLFYRLRVVTVEIAPLRERREDIPVLAAHFAAKAAEKHGRPVPELEPSLVEALCEYEWPGNVRELENLIERLVVLTREGPLGAEFLPEKMLKALPTPAPAGPAAHEGAPDETTLEGATIALRRRMVISALQAEGGNRAAAAKRLAISRSYLHRLISELSISGV